MHDNYLGLDEKSTRIYAGSKLAIGVQAWEYPPGKDPKHRVKLLWKTTAYVDDGEHRDLNTISLKMLESAAPYFDQHIQREHEVVVNIPSSRELPEGHVKVGTPEVVGTDANKSK